MIDRLKRAFEGLGNLAKDLCRIQRDDSRNTSNWLTKWRAGEARPGGPADLWPGGRNPYLPPAAPVRDHAVSEPVKFPPDIYDVAGVDNFLRQFEGKPFAAGTPSGPLLFRVSEVNESIGSHGLPDGAVSTFQVRVTNANGFWEAADGKPIAHWFIQYSEVWARASPDRGKFRARFVSEATNLDAKAAADEADDEVITSMRSLGSPPFHT